MTLTRRHFTAGLAGAGALGALPSWAQAGELVFCSWGGSYQEAIRKAWLEPFSKKTGIRVREDTNPEVAKLQAMVTTRTVSWDVITGGGTTLMQGIAAGLFEPIPADKVDQSATYPQARYEFGVPSEIFSTVFAYSQRAFPASRPQPKTWADFFDPVKFPGKRTIYDRPPTVLEAALLADGVPAGEVYKVLDTKAGQDQAFAKLAAIKPHVAKWWRSGAEPVQLLGSGDAVLALGWNGRFQTGIEEGLQIRQVFEGQVAQLGFFMVPKGAPNKEAAYQFLSFMATAEAQAEFHKYIVYGPTTPKAYDRIPKEKWAMLPGSPDAKIDLFLDIAWWAKNNQAMFERYQTFIQT